MSRVTREPRIRVPAAAAPTNAGGDVFGGWLMSQMDIAGSVPAVTRARGRVVTVAVERMQFRKPVQRGDMVSVFAEVIRVGRSSMTVAVEVCVDRNPANPETLTVADALLVYVAVDEQGRPRALPPGAYEASE
jgi:acyl-CoA thioesterase YciA